MSPIGLGRSTNPFARLANSARGIALAALLVACVLSLAPRPAAAQFVTEFDASLSTCEGCQAGNVTLTMDGGRAVAYGLVQDQTSGKWNGFGSLEYSRSGVKVNESNARFEVVFVGAPDGGCIPAIQFPSVIQIYDASDTRILFASGLHYDPGYNVPAGRPCPWGRLTANVGKVPNSLVALKLKYLR